MTAKMKKMRRRALFGWVWWAIVIAPVFGVLFFETWINAEIRRLDYHITRVERETRALESELDQLRVKEARLQSFNRLAQTAPDFGLRPANPDQIQTILYDPVNDQILDEIGGVLVAREEPARGPGRSPVDAAKPERTALAKAESEPAAPTAALRPSEAIVIVPSQSGRGAAPAPSAPAALEPHELDSSIENLLGAL